MTTISITASHSIAASTRTDSSLSRGMFAFPSLRREGVANDLVDEVSGGNSEFSRPDLHPVPGGTGQDYLDTLPLRFLGYAAWKWCVLCVYHEWYQYYVEVSTCQVDNEEKVCLNKSFKSGSVEQTAIAEWCSKRRSTGV